ncbi:SNF1-related protein kinase regulatory subunit gamma-like PV42a [Amborella trichopoda]|uniref:CBS domain-containing protein n=1 Tax=Amborella trichopoda TaxID=13333 RepID=U5CXA1_AMBTC|nr:SNF1-related protein kinase regulatory subunit gamma-like PV42a [Amborella trichopoda]ERN17961.1 hypothetical protein AMTR_s00046p00081950 [Amborella trichopoda]|eukprot:XP_006856494.1 SNF1-related protein kinase regulatory subunit gamma-like PV42a [Amborella trichopoda]
MELQEKKEEELEHGIWKRNVRDLMERKRRLVEVPYTASLTDTINALVANDIVAIPVAAPPGRWIGAGGSAIVESDKVTGAPRKQYIGMVSMLDILIHIADYMDMADLEERMNVPVSSLIGHCLEGLSLWTVNPSNSILDCMEAFSKGIHRALVPMDGHMDHVTGLELAESSPGYRMLSQMDVLSFLREHDSELEKITSLSVGELGAIQENVFAVPKHMAVREVLRWMRSSSLSAVPVIEDPVEDHKVIMGKGKKLVETFSATDLRGCPSSSLKTWLSLPVIDFMNKVSIGTRTEPVKTPRPLITCGMGSSLGEVMGKAVDHHVHRVWVVDDNGLLLGLVTLTDILRVIRASFSSL